MIYLTSSNKTNYAECSAGSFLKPEGTEQYLFFQYEFLEGNLKDPFPLSVNMGFPLMIERVRKNEKQGKDLKEKTISEIAEEVFQNVSLLFQNFSPTISKPGGLFDKIISSNVLQEENKNTYKDIINNSNAIKTFHQTVAQLLENKNKFIETVSQNLYNKLFGYSDKLELSDTNHTFFIHDESVAKENGLIKNFKEIKQSISFNFYWDKDNILFFEMKIAFERESNKELDLFLKEHEYSYSQFQKYFDLTEDWKINFEEEQDEEKPINQRNIENSKIVRSEDKIPNELHEELNKTEINQNKNEKKTIENQMKEMSFFAKILNYQLFFSLFKGIIVTVVLLGIGGYIFYEYYYKNQSSEDEKKGKEKTNHDKTKQDSNSLKDGEKLENKNESEDRNELEQKTQEEENVDISNKLEKNINELTVNDESNEL